MLDLIGVGFDLCGLRLGSRLGPAALRLAGLQHHLESLGQEVRDVGDVTVDLSPGDPSSLPNLGRLVHCVSGLRIVAQRSLAEGRLPIVLGGDHTLVVGGIAAALERHGRELGVLWIDAHGDVNTPGSSISGNVHGMPLAALAGMDSGVSDQRRHEWEDLLTAIGPTRLDLQNVVWYGLREVDSAERQNLTGLAITMHDIDRFGPVDTIYQADAHFRTRGVNALWVSFDVDALDPILAPGTGTAVRGGLTYREAHLLAELVHECLTREDCPYRLVGVDLVEVNPLHDTLNQTAVMGVEWVASLFGKRILG